MSALGRMCLRLAACAALRNATIAGEAVFDSRVEATDLSPDPTGVIAVYTEQDEGEALSAQNGGPPFVSDVELILEITMMVCTVADDQTVEIGAPATDAQLEASLDTIEAQAELALFRSFAPNSVLFRQVAKRPKQKTSIRFTDPKSSAKLAIRYVTFKIEIDDAETPVYDASLTGLDRLPEPFRTIAQGWPDDAPEKAQALAVAAALPGTTPPAFLGISATVHPPVSTQTPGTDPNPSRTLDWTMQP